jgi:hypothetical protein
MPQVSALLMAVRDTPRWLRGGGEERVRMGEEEGVRRRELG